MQRLRFGFARNREMKFLSHLDMMRLFQRAFRRASLPVSYSHGFNPQPRLSIAAPLPLGVTAGNEPADIYLEEHLSPPSFVQALNTRLPGGITVLDAVEIPQEDPPLMQRVDAALYTAFLLSGEQPWPEGILQDGVEEIKKKEELRVTRTGKKGTRVIDIRPYVYNIELQEKDGGGNIKMFLQTGSRGGARPVEVLRVLGEMCGMESLPFILQLHRIGLFHRNKGRWEQIT